MGHLDKLKIVAQQQKQAQNKTEHRRNKLIEKLDDQLGLLQALIDGGTFTRTRRVWRKDEAGESVLIERPKRIRPWYWMSGAGGCFFQVWYGSKVIELKPGLTAVQVNKREELLVVIRSIIDAVKNGELDVQIEDVARKSTADLRVKSKTAVVKKAG